ncbi:MAG TPA: hypothetical protein VGM84_27360 [Steroidobacteraceae bacterium]|jgi:hypothetical protein
MMNRSTQLALLALLGSLCAAQVPSAPQSPGASLRHVTVDVSKPIGTLRSLSGVNGAPAPGMHKPENFTFGGWNMPEKVDASSGYRRARIDLVRTHDGYGPGDIDARFETDKAPGGALISAKRDVFAIFQHPDADPNDPASYNFAPTDKQIGSIRALGAQVIFRLGRSEGANPTPPKDFQRYANIAKHIVMHYNGGWANGFHYGIRYWEIWNEPDLGKVFWAGTAAQFFDLYGKVARAVKDADPHALVGGPAIARPNDNSPYRDEFMSWVVKNKVPLDFYSWHWYATDSEDPLDFVRIARDLRARLDQHGLHKTESLLTEWNYGLDDPPPLPLVRASFITSSIVYMQDAPIDAATLYRADNVFGADGNTPDKTGAALILLGQMKDTLERLRAQGGDPKGLAVEAARTPDGRVVRILVSNYQIPAQRLGPRSTADVIHVPEVFDVKLLKRRSVTYSDNGGVDLTLTGLKPGSYEVQRCGIGAESAFSVKTDTILAESHIILPERMPPPGVELITLWPAGTPAPAFSCGTAAKRASQTADRLD